MHPLLLLAALLMAALMGLAIQRGATCAVLAVDELLHKRRATRLIAMAETSLWVAAGLVIAGWWHAMPPLPVAHGLSWATAGGAALLGLGAVVNGACVFGAIARLGLGESAYVFTPLGFFIGSWSTPMRAPHAAPPLDLGLGWLVVLAAAAWGAWHLWRWARGGAHWRWSPAAATALIGATFLVLLLLQGPWTYTDVLAEWARGMASASSFRLLLFVCLVLGAVLGGWRTARWRRPAPVTVLRCLAGGALMAWGTSLIPGGNDHLILVALPLGAVHAWLAMTVMVLVIALALHVRDRATSTG